MSNFNKLNYPLGMPITVIYNSVIVNERLFSMSLPYKVEIYRLFPIMRLSTCNVYLRRIIFVKRCNWQQLICIKIWWFD